ncbi:MAG: ketopantoate reductase family protein [Clostridia bacterium]|nr:ketopantoate reductase family protein [Clostridia bacterium]
MKIAVLGAGAMGSIYGGHLSLENEVYMIDKKQELVNKINSDGLKIFENGTDTVYKPTAFSDSRNLNNVDLVILFVKSLFSREALKENSHIIGDNTYVMTLQNGAGHEEIISEFVPMERIIIGTTEDNGAVLENGYVKRGGKGKTNIGMLVPDNENVLDRVKESFDKCGFDTHIYENIQQLIWDKLFTNVSLSALTGVLQVPIGYIARDEYAWNMTVTLIKEALNVAEALGLKFNENEIVERVKNVSINSPEGLTSIYADLKAGRKTEVDTISGAVVRAGEKTGVSVPSHKLIVNMVHAMENKAKQGG